jgi:hypothetical protein
VPQVSINGRALDFQTVKRLQPSEVQDAIRQAKGDGKDDVIVRQAEDVFMLSSTKNVDISGIETAKYRKLPPNAVTPNPVVNWFRSLVELGSPAEYSGKHVVVEALDDELK